MENFQWAFNQKQTVKYKSSKYLRTVFREFEIFRSVVTNFEKLQTLNESDGNSENELLDIGTDEYEGQGSSESDKRPCFENSPEYPWFRIRRLLG